MANEEHVAIVKQGPKALDKWREENPDTELDLKRADFSKVKLSVMNFRGANLGGANLSGTDFTGADLSETSLWGAKLIGATLWAANLRGAELSKADLSGAKLFFANLREANLRGANLREADLSGTKLRSTTIKGTMAEFAIVDGGTLIDCEDDQWDRQTNFSNVGLDSARIEERLKAALKRNTREIYWKRRYTRNRWYRFMQPFWWASDYGSSTTRILITFVILSIVFSLPYIIPAEAPQWMPLQFEVKDFVNGLEPEDNYSEFNNTTKLLILWGRAFYFSIVTMTTLGFGDISANPDSFWGHLLVMIQVLLGYFFLGALITRLSILFQDVD